MNWTWCCLVGLSCINFIRYISGKFLLFQHRIIFRSYRHKINFSSHELCQSHFGIANNEVFHSVKIRKSRTKSIYFPIIWISFQNNFLICYHLHKFIWPVDYDLLWIDIREPDLVHRTEIIFVYKRLKFVLGVYINM